MLPRPFRIDKIWRETRDVFSFEARPAQGGGAFRFKPGQFNMLYAFGAGEAPISISGEGSRPGSIIHTVRSVGAVTAALKKLGPGDSIGLRGPFGNPWPLEEIAGKDVVVMAGGLGLAPLRPAVESLLWRRENYGRLSILYGTRTPLDILFRRELGRWRRRPGVDLAVTVDRPRKGWRGAVGGVMSLLSGLRINPSKTAALVCGPEVMMRFCSAELRKRGLPGENIHLSLERNMKCAVGFCGHCQLGPAFLCKDGPVFSFERIGPLLNVRGL